MNGLLKVEVVKRLVGRVLRRGWMDRSCNNTMRFWGVIRHLVYALYVAPFYIIS